MRQQELLNELRDLLGQFAYQVEAGSAMQLYDVNKIAEDLILGLMKQLCDFSNLRNLNVEEKKNFPGIDLADDQARVAVQVTSTASLEKIKDTIKTFHSHGLNQKYDRLIIYILTRKQSSYSQAAVDKIYNGELSFSVATDVMDFRDLAGKSVSASPKQLGAAVSTMQAYLRGVGAGLADEDFDPPESPIEDAHLNLLELFFPPVLYIAPLRPELAATRKSKAARYSRKSVRKHCQKVGIKLPSGYEISGGNIITFYKLDDHDNPFQSIIDYGAVERIDAIEFYENDDDCERVFKSLLRFALQQKLYKEHVVWEYKDQLFVFHPRPGDGDVREESWRDKRQSTRKVFERTSLLSR